MICEDYPNIGWIVLPQASNLFMIFRPKARFLMLSQVSMRSPVAHTFKELAWIDSCIEGSTPHRSRQFCVRISNNGRLFTEFPAGYSYAVIFLNLKNASKLNCIIKHVSFTRIRSSFVALTQPTIDDTKKHGTSQNQNTTVAHHGYKMLF